MSGAGEHPNYPTFSLKRQHKYASILFVRTDEQMVELTKLSERNIMENKILEALQNIALNLNCISTNLEEVNYNLEKNNQQLKFIKGNLQAIGTNASRDYEN